MGIKSWVRKSSLWPVRFCIACCSTEMAATMASRFDMERFGVMSAWGPRQGDFLMIAGYVSKKMAKRLIQIYEQMPEPRYVMALGDCAMSGGPYWDSYNVINDVGKLVPIDVYVAGCPPRPEAILKGIEIIQDLISKDIHPKGNKPVVVK